MALRSLPRPEAPYAWGMAAGFGTGLSWLLSARQFGWTGGSSRTSRAM